MSLPALPSVAGSGNPSSVRRPACQVQFAGSGGGGLGGTLGAAAGALGQGGAADPWQESLVAVSVTLGLAPEANVAEIYLAAGARAPAAAVGDIGSISLGYDDAAPVAVFSGQVSNIRRTVQGLTRLTATDGGATLAGLRLNQGYEQQTAGEIVSDLAGRGGVATGTVDAGSSFPYYVVDDRSSAYAQIAALARKCGLLAYLTPEGKLSFTALNASSIQTFTYGVDVLALSVSEAAPPGKATVTGEGAAGSQGQAAWSWLIKDPTPVTGKAGTGLPERASSDPALRSAEAAGSAANALADGAGRLAQTGTLVAPGAPAVSAGTAFEVAGAPQAELNGTYLAAGVRHRYSKAAGFTTLIYFVKAADGGATGGSPGGLPGGLG